jgi:hypothetical protein
MQTINTDFIPEPKPENSSFMDPIRGGKRIEIISGTTLLWIKNNNNKEKIKKNLDLIIKEQKDEGYWLEYSYEPTEEKVGYYGAIPTSFCIITLLEGYLYLKEDRYLYAAIKGCDYLYSQEKKGYFFKAKNNKSDVINTNLMCSIALLNASKIMNKKSRRIETYKSACTRAIRRSINSQFLSGAYPYTSYGLSVPYLYHSMTLALLTVLYYDFQDSHLAYSIKKGLNFLKNYLKNGGEVDWNSERFKEKSGAVWIYAWNHCIFSSLEQKILLKKTEAQLKRLKGEEFFYTGDLEDKEDPFYSSWCFIALSLSKRVSIKTDITGIVRFYLSSSLGLFRRITLILKIIERKIFSFKLDKGPVEYW